MKERLKSDKLLKAAFLAGIAAIVLIFVSGISGRTAAADKTVSAEGALEARTAQMLSAIDGMEEELPVVMIKLDGDGRTVLGVTVICKNAGNPVLKEKMLEALSKALDVPLLRICITA